MVEAPRTTVSNGVLGVLVFVAAEVMLFAGFASAFLIGKASAGALAWPPLDQPRLPVAATALNTVVLVASGVVLALSQRAFRTAPAGRRAHRLVTLALGLGGTFVALQGYEWLGLVRFGLTLTSSSYGSFFYLIVGAHAVHAVAAIAALAWATVRLTTRGLAAEAFATVAVFWYFVVALWPPLYGLVYLT
jgi:heme/copper-type cytochrome/quinol oxidase subunit 3